MTLDQPRPSSVEAPFPHSIAPRKTRAGKLVTSRPTTQRGGATLPPAGPNLLSTDQDLHWLRRLTYAPLGHTLDEIKHVGRATWLNRQLQPGALPDPNVVSSLALLPLATAAPSMIRSSIKTKSLDAVTHLQLATITRATYSTKQLYERMVEHWHERLHATSTGGDNWDLLPQRDQVLRTFALGRFADLLPASTRDPAMLRVLNADTSRGKNPNENLGRELLELHTVGSGNYSELDVLNSARALTGLAIAVDGTPTYNAQNHYVGPLQVMGWTHPNSSTEDGDAVIASYLDYLARHPATATHVCTKLAQRFVSDDVDPTLISAMVKAFADFDTNMTSVIKVMVHHKAFAASVGMRTRTPYEAAIAAVRILRCQFVGVPGVAHPAIPFLKSLEMIGAAPTQWPTPEGAHTDAESVSSAGYCLASWNLHQQLTTNSMPGFYSPAAGLLGAVSARTPVQIVIDRTLRILLQQDVTLQHREALAAYLTGGRRLTSIGSAADLPGFMALVMGSPYGAMA